MRMNRGRNDRHQCPRRLCKPGARSSSDKHGYHENVKEGHLEWGRLRYDGCPKRGLAHGDGDASPQRSRLRLFHPEGPRRQMALNLRQIAIRRLDNGALAVPIR